MIFLDLIFPPKTTCLICKNAIKTGYICEKCKNTLKFIQGNTCSICGKPINYEGICHDCLHYGHVFRQNVSTFEYDDAMKGLIARFKYFKERHLAAFFAEYMAISLEDMKWPIDVIVPVPLHKSKLDERGYNQAELLARELSYRFDIFMTKALRRIRNTPTQTALHREERINNVKGAFKIMYKETVMGKNVLLIDDILTTGATLDECARVLKDSGANEVYAGTIATGRNM